MLTNVTIKSRISGNLVEWGMPSCCHGSEIRYEVSKKENISINDFYLLSNGRIVNDSFKVSPGIIVHSFLKVNGGKGGFGSMLRAIGAQIEKTTNREACRDLSGRRLRDINEEKRLKKWIAEKADREREAMEKKMERLERLKAEPKHEFHDTEYDKQRSDLSENINDALAQGLKNAASSSSVAPKRKTNKSDVVPSKKKRLWMGMDDISDELSSDSEVSSSGSDNENSNSEVKHSNSHSSDDVTKLQDSDKNSAATQPSNDVEQTNEEGEREEGQKISG